MKEENELKWLRAIHGGTLKEVMGEIRNEILAATPSGGGEKWTPEHVEQLAFSGGHASAYELIASAHNATSPRDCGENTAQKIVDLAYRVILEHSGECEIENLPNAMQCLIDAMKSQP